MTHHPSQSTWPQMQIPAATPASLRMLTSIIKVLPSSWTWEWRSRQPMEAPHGCWWVRVCPVCFGCFSFHTGPLPSIYHHGIPESMTLPALTDHSPAAFLIADHSVFIVIMIFLHLAAGTHASQLFCLPHGLHLASSVGISFSSSAVQMPQGHLVVLGPLSSVCSYHLGGPIWSHGLQYHHCLLVH